MERSQTFSHCKKSFGISDETAAFSTVTHYTIRLGWVSSYIISKRETHGSNFTHMFRTPDFKQHLNISQLGMPWTNLDAEANYIK